MNLTSNLACDAGVAEPLVPLTAISCTLAFMTGAAKGCSSDLERVDRSKKNGGKKLEGVYCCFTITSPLGKDWEKCWKKMAPECSSNSYYFSSLIIV